MAGFIDIEMAPVQFKYVFGGRKSIVAYKAKSYTLTKSIHYGAFLAFEGIRFFIKKNRGGYEAVFLNLDHNLRRFRESMAFYLEEEKEDTIPTPEELMDMIEYYFSHPKMRDFIKSTASKKKFGYLRPYTLDEAISIGVDFPTTPSIWMAAASFSGYLGEPFEGAVVPDIVRAVRTNGTGRLKLGINYPLSLRAIRLARSYNPAAKTALLLDDKFWMPPEERSITEWDSSCFLMGLEDGSVVGIPDGPLILPSVTIRGISAVLREIGVPIERRNVSYGELLELNESGKLSVVASVGTAGVLNRCDRLVLTSDSGVIGEHRIDRESEAYAILGQARDAYLSYYTNNREPPEGIERITIRIK